MHCILNYPTNDKDANLKMISSLKRNFKNYVIGYSDHTLPDKNMLNISTAFILGAKVIEKHFTLDKKQKGNDHYHAMDVNDLRTLTNNLKRTVQILGCRDKKEVLESEKKSRKFARRCIVIKNDVKKKIQFLKRKILLHFAQI